MRVLLGLAAAKLVSISTSGFVRKETITDEMEDSANAGARYTCTIQDNAEFLGRRGGMFITTSFPVSRCSMRTCSVLNVVGGGAPGRQHISHSMKAIRASRSGQAKDDGNWCLCREKIDNGRLLISFGGVREEKPCSADQCYDEYVRYVEKFVLEETPGTTGLGRTNWRESTADPTAATASYWSRACCDASQPGCPVPPSAIVPFRSLLKQLETKNPNIHGERARQLQIVAEEQIDLGESSDEPDEALGSGGSSSTRGSLSNDGAGEQVGVSLWKINSGEGMKFKFMKIREEASLTSTVTDSKLQPDETFLVSEVKKLDDGEVRLKLADGRGWTSSVFHGDITAVQVVDHEQPLDEDLDLSEASAYDASQDPHSEGKVTTPDASLDPERPRTPQRPRDPVPSDAVRDGRIQRGLSPTSTSSPVTPTEAKETVPIEFQPVVRPAEEPDLMYAEWQYKWTEPFCLSGSKRVLMSWELACMLVYDDREVPGDFALCGQDQKPPALLKVAPPSMASASAWLASDVPSCDIRHDACCGRGGCRPEFLDACVKHLPKDVTDPHAGPDDF